MMRKRLECSSEGINPTVKRLKDAIDAHRDQNATLELHSSQPLLDDDDAEEVAAALSAQTTAKSVYINFIMLTPRGADAFINALAAPKSPVSKIRFPVYGNVVHPSQRPLMEREELYPEWIEAHNYTQKHNMRSYAMFVKLNSKVIKISRESSEEVQSEKPPPLLFQFEQAFLEKMIKPFIVSPAPIKKFILEPKLST